MNGFQKFFLILFFIPFFTGCFNVISKDLRQQIDPAITVKQVFDNPDAFKGKMILWGGEIIQTMNQKDGTTLIEVFQTPLGWRGEPKDTKESVLSEGRFLILIPTYVDSYLYRKGRKITVSGEIQGEMTKTLDEMNYRYPVVMSKQTYLWEEYQKDYPSRHYYYYEPWWNYPYYVVPHVHHHHKD
ncbi:MAG TPA: Slp family lipoprotein [Thermodesulfobacteriota bacterium]|nr:Slp family lipoprotein [Thermodesulfobacteriota bacterium]